MDKSKKSVNYSVNFLMISCSIILNLFALVHICKPGSIGSSWTKRAAEEAEAVASVRCSGHGRAYLDGLFLDNGKPICECNSCFTGPDCSIFTPGCMVDADSGNPMFLEPFWMQNEASSALVISGWHRMGYEFDDGSLISKQLEIQIRKLHDSVGNAVTSGKYLIFGAGSTQLLNAAVYALSSQSSSPSPANIVTSSPYYPVYKSQTKLFESVKYKFAGDTSLWKNNSESNSRNFIEFVTSPNNPDGQLKKAILHGSNVKTIHDLAYHWPHYTPIPAPIDEDLMLFTLSKLTGHAGSRFGWAFVKEKAVYERMLEYMDLNTYGVPRETQLRALKLLRVVLEGRGRKMFEFGYKTMNSRWEKLSKTFTESKRFSIQDLPPQYSTFSEDVRAPSPAFAWIKCEQEEDMDCHAVLRGANITGREGKVFGSDSRYVRLSVCKSQDDFDLLLHRLKMLVLEERVTELMVQLNSRENKIVEINSKNDTYYSGDRLIADHIIIEELSLHENNSLPIFPVVINS